MTFAIFAIRSGKDPYANEFRTLDLNAVVFKNVIFFDNTLVRPNLLRSAPRRSIILVKPSQEGGFSTYLTLWTQGDNGLAVLIAEVQFMKKLSLLVVLSFQFLATNSDSAWAQDAQEGVTYKSTQTLPKVKWHKSRLKVQLVDDSPEVTDCRPELTAPKRLYIAIPPRSVPQAEDIYVGVPDTAGRLGQSGQGGLGAGSPGAGQPGIVMINTDRPAPARFDSNIPKRGFSQRNRLPGGQSTNLLANQAVSGRMNPPSDAGMTFVPKPSRIAPKKSLGSSPLVYADTTDGSFGAGSRSQMGSRSALHGKLLHPGDLLNSTSK